MQRSDFGVEQHMNLGLAADPIDQIIGHVHFQRILANYHVHSRGIAGKMQRRLTGGVTAAHQIHLLATAQHGLARTSTVIDTRSGEAILVR